MKEIAEDTAVPEAIRDVANKGVAVATIPIFDVNRYMRPDAIAFKTPFGGNDEILISKKVVTRTVQISLMCDFLASQVHIFSQVTCSETHSGSVAQKVASKALEDFYSPFADNEHAWALMIEYAEMSVTDQAYAPSMKPDLYTFVTGPGFESLWGHFRTSSYVLVCLLYSRMPPVTQNKAFLSFALQCTGDSIPLPVHHSITHPPITRRLSCKTICQATKIKQDLHEKCIKSPVAWSITLGHFCNFNRRFYTPPSVKTPDPCLVASIKMPDFKSQKPGLQSIRSLITTKITSIVRYHKKEARMRLFVTVDNSAELQRFLQTPVDTTAAESALSMIIRMSPANPELAIIKEFVNNSRVPQQFQDQNQMPVQLPQPAHQQPTFQGNNQPIQPVHQPPVMAHQGPSHENRGMVNFQHQPVAPQGISNVDHGFNQSFFNGGQAQSFYGNNAENGSNGYIPPQQAAKPDDTYSAFVVDDPNTVQCDIQINELQLSPPTTDPQGSPAPENGTTASTVAPVNAPPTATIPVATTAPSTSTASPSTYAGAVTSAPGRPLRQNRRPPTMDGVKTKIERLCNPSSTTGRNNDK